MDKSTHAIASDSDNVKVLEEELELQKGQVKFLMSQINDNETILVNLQKGFEDELKKR